MKNISTKTFRSWNNQTIYFPYFLNDRSCTRHSDSLWSCRTFQPMVSGQSVCFPGRQNSLPEGEVDGHRQKEGRLTDTLQQQTEKWQHYTDTVNRINWLFGVQAVLAVYQPYNGGGGNATTPFLPVNGCNRPLLDNLRSLSRDSYRATPVETGDRVFGVSSGWPPPPIPSLLTTPKSYMWN